MKIQVSITCDNNGGSHYAELGAWELSDVHDIEHAGNTFDDLVSELRRQAKAEGWLLVAGPNGWTRASCPACCGGQGGG